MFHHDISLGLKQILSHISPIFSNTNIGLSIVFDWKMFLEPFQGLVWEENPPSRTMTSIWMLAGNMWAVNMGLPRVFDWKIQCNVYLLSDSASLFCRLLRSNNFALNPSFVWIKVLSIASWAVQCKTCFTTLLCLACLFYLKKNYDLF